MDMGEYTQQENMAKLYPLLEDVGEYKTWYE